MSKPKNKAARNAQGGGFFGKLQSHEDPGRRTDDELPDGLVTNVPNRLRSNVQHLQPVIRIAKYICSFPVESGDHNSRIELVQKRLQLLQTQIKGVELKTVYLYVSIEGIRVAAASNPDLFMFHSVRRISYAACNPEHCQFSFLARPPQTPGSLQFCHVFLVPSASQAEELHSLVGNCFKLAFAHQIAATNNQPNVALMPTQQNAHANALFTMQQSVVATTAPAAAIQQNSANQQSNVQHNALAQTQANAAPPKQPHTTNSTTDSKAKNAANSGANPQPGTQAGSAPPPPSSQATSASSHNVVAPVALVAPGAPSIVLPGPPASSHTHVSQSSGLGSSVTTSQTTNDTTATATRHCAANRLPKRIIVTSSMKGRRSVSVSSLSIASSCSSSSSSTATAGASTIYTSTCSCTTCTCACSCCEAEAEAETEAAQRPPMSSRCSSLTDLDSFAKHTPLANTRLHIDVGGSKRRSSPPAGGRQRAVNDENARVDRMANDNDVRLRNQVSQPDAALVARRNVTDGTASGNQESANGTNNNGAAMSQLHNVRGGHVRRHGKRSRCSSRASHHSHRSHHSHARGLSIAKSSALTGAPLNQPHFTTAQVHSHHVVQVTVARNAVGEHRSQQHATTRQDSLGNAPNGSRTDTLNSVTSLTTNSSTLTNVTAFNNGQPSGGAGGQTSSSNSTISSGAQPTDSTFVQARHTNAAQLACIAANHANSAVQMPVASAGCHMPANLIAVSIPTVPGGTMLQAMPNASSMLSSAMCAEYDELWQYAWYKGDLPRESVCDLLNDSDVGSFIVRYSSTHPGAFALSVRVPKADNPVGVSHYLVLRCENGCYRLKGLAKQWPSIPALIVHLSVIPEMLPCTLKLPTMRLTERNLLFNEQQVAFRRQQSAHASVRSSFVVPVSQPLASQVVQSHTHAQSQSYPGQSHVPTQMQMQAHITHTHAAPPPHTHAANAMSQQRATGTGTSGKLPRQTSGKQRSKQEAIVEDHDESHETDYHRLAHFSSVMSNLKAQS